MALMVPGNLKKKGRGYQVGASWRGEKPEFGKFKGSKPKHSKGLKQSIVEAVKPKPPKKKR